MISAPLLEKEAPRTGRTGASRAGGSGVSHAAHARKGALRVFRLGSYRFFMVETSTTGLAGYYLV